MATQDVATLNDGCAQVIHPKSTPRSRIVGSREIEEVLALTEDERQAVRILEQEFPLRVTEHYLRLLDPANPLDPLRKLVIPSLEEAVYRPLAEDEDVHADEARYQPCPGIVHRYPGKLLLMPTLRCVGHCRFCFRKGRKVQDLERGEWETALAYIRDDETIRDVVVTGGDPLALSDRKLIPLLEEVRRIRHVQILRLTSRVPIYDPARISGELVEGLAALKPFYLIFSFVHPREITPDLADGIDRLADRGVVLLQQGPLLKGVNDDPRVLKELYERLAALRVRPYYAAYGLTAPGIEHFVVDGPTARRVVGALENQTSGCCLPHLITLAAGTKVRTIGWSGEGARHGSRGPSAPAPWDDAGSPG